MAQTKDSAVEMGNSNNTNVQTEFLTLRQAAIKILSSVDKAVGMTPGDIYEEALVEELVDPNRKGKTPVATLSASFYSEIKKNGAKSTFLKVGKGKFGLNPNAESTKERGSKSNVRKVRSVESKTDLRAKSSNSHPHGKSICGVRQKTKNGSLICRIPWTGERHAGEHNFEPFRKNKMN
ncbi:MAG: winged helix-turn-helix domain-containing protein [Nitrososphaerales archaeon]|jgi:hypothetical protein